MISGLKVIKIGNDFVTLHLSTAFTCLIQGRCFICSNF